MTGSAPRRRRGRPKGATRYERSDAETLSKMADQLSSNPTLSMAEAIRQATGKSNDPSLFRRLRRKFRAQQTALMAAAADRRNRPASPPEREALPMIHPIADTAMPLITAVTGAVAGSTFSSLLSRSQRRAARTPPVRLEFEDLPGHENLGAIGFRHMEYEFALRVSGTLRNGGAMAAFDLRFDIYHYQNSKARPTHEIIGIPVADMLQPGEAMPWNRLITLADVTVNHPKGYYRSGHTGIFRDDFNNRYYHYHMVLSWRNDYDEKACAIYGMEKVIEGTSFKMNKMVFVGQATTYDPRKQFPVEWRDEIKAKERFLKQLMAVPVGAPSSANPDFCGAS
jgi:hypothetical protein